MNLPSKLLENAVNAFATLPGIGKKTALRLVLHLAKTPAEQSEQLSEAITQMRHGIQQCQRCHNLADEVICTICADPRRDASLVCVIERPVDIISVEKSGTYRGKFHVLGGKISPLNGVEPEDLRIAELEKRLGAEPIKEVILALGTDVEGDATSFYLAKRFAAKGVKVTRIAHGLPAGSGLEFADELTLSHALEGRRELS